MNNNTIILNGENLETNDIYRIVTDEFVKVEIEESALIKLDEVRGFVQSEMDTKLVYGINTGFGPMASYVMGKGQLLELQVNLIRGHAVGIGKPVEERFVLAAMVVRLNTLIKGYSGASRELALRLQMFINERIIPIVPEHGAVGTSGDLVQLAHIALALIGEGEVFYKGEKISTSQVFNQLQISTYALQPKEGLVLINGTSFMSGVGAVLCAEAGKLLSIAVQSGALALELIHGYADSISEKLHSVRPHHGQVVVAGMLRELLKDSTMLHKRSELQKKVEINGEVHQIPFDVQDVYSMRCTPQILGPIYDTYKKTLDVVNIEINSATDNPIIDVESEGFLHGGNFHGDYVATALDQLKMALAKLSMLSERRTNYFLHAKLNAKFPPFLNLETLGLNMGLQGLQFVATSTTAQNQTLAYPHSIHSIPTNGDNQDVVSMGTDVALFTSKVVENTFAVLTIELIVLLQALDCLEKNVDESFSTASTELYEQVRKIFPSVTVDRSLTQELHSVIEYLKQRKSVV